MTCCKESSSSHAQTLLLTNFNQVGWGTISKGHRHLESTLKTFLHPKFSGKLLEH